MPPFGPSSPLPAPSHEFASQFPRLSVDHSQQDHAEAFLHLRVLEQLVEHNLRFCAALQFDHNTHTVAVTLVSDVGDVLDVLSSSAVIFSTICQACPISVE